MLHHNIFSLTQNGWTALHMAAQGGNTDIVEDLIKHNGSILNKTDKGNIGLWLHGIQILKSVRRWLINFTYI